MTIRPARWKKTLSNEWLLERLGPMGETVGFPGYELFVVKGTSGDGCTMADQESSAQSAMRSARAAHAESQPSYCLEFWAVKVFACRSLALKRP